MIIIRHYNFIYAPFPSSLTISDNFFSFFKKRRLPSKQLILVSFPSCLQNINQPHLKSMTIRNQYNNFLPMSQLNEANVFFEQKHQSTENLLASRPNECPDSIPYLKKGDSNSYLDQFLIIKEELPEPAEHSNKQESKQVSVSNQRDEQYLAEEQAKFSSSSYHNFQKHLTVCLKHSIDIHPPENAMEHHLAACKLWKAFKASNFSTKKILHYLLGEKNEHQITQEGIHQYGFGKIYVAHDDRIMSEARRYLADCTLNQIKEGKLKEYLDGKKLKDKDRFRRYVEIFTNELSNGFLRKRLPKESVQYLQNP